MGSCNRDDRSNALACHSLRRAKYLDEEFAWHVLLEIQRFLPTLLTYLLLWRYSGAGQSWGYLFDNLLSIPFYIWGNCGG